MRKEPSEFIKAIEVTALHVERYSRQVNRLLDTQAYSEEDYENGKVGKTQYYRQRNKKIKAYSDAVDTLNQKERLLQFHNSGFKINISEEKTVINCTPQTKWDLSALSFDEKVEMLELMQKSKINQAAPMSITPNTTLQLEGRPSMEIVEERPNIELIKQIEVPAKPEFTLRPVDPIMRLQGIINKVAAKRFSEVGTLTEEERESYNLP